MTTTPDRSTEIASYLAAVERHLNDLPTHIRQDLMSELDTHLTEVAADLEPGASLRDLLGGPEAYARELRDTAEVDKEPVAKRMRRQFSELAAPALTRLKAGADKYAVSTGHADAAELRERLRPGWWVLRGALVAALFVYWLSSAQYGVTGYSIFGSIPGLLLMVAVLLVSVWASMRLGAKAMDWRGRRRRWMIAGGVAIVALAGYQFAWMFSGIVPVQMVDTASDGGDQYSYISDVYAYDENGNLLTGVYLFDQDGNPLWIGDPYNCPVAAENPFGADSTIEEYEYDQYGNAVENTDDRYGYQYPLCVPGSDPTMPGPGEDPTTELPAGETPSEIETSPQEPTGEAATTPEESPTPGDDPTE
jgi:hypothetical protein